MGRVVTELSTYDSRVSAAQHQKVKVKKPFVVIHVHAYMDSNAPRMGKWQELSWGWEEEEGERQARISNMPNNHSSKYVLYLMTSLR